MSRQRLAPHGTYGCATRGCRCDPCVAARRRYDKQQKLKRYRGETNRIDAAETRARVQRLMEAGATYSQIARATGTVVKESQVRRLIEGNPRNGHKPVRWLFAPAVNALGAVTVEAAMRQDSLRPAFGAHRRLMALQYMGHSIHSLGAELGVGEDMISRYMKSDQMMLSTLERIDRLYQRLAMVRGDSERVRWRAYRSDYAPPMAWDEWTLDDPAAEPDRSAIRCIVDKCTRVAHRYSICEAHIRRVKERGGFLEGERFREVVLWLGKRQNHGAEAALAALAELKELGVSVEEAAARSGRTVSYVERLWREVA